MGAALEAAMLEAHRAGLSVIPLRSGKRPALTTWAEFVEAQPDELAVRRWARDAEGFAMLCGGQLRTQVLDFEAAFVANHWHAFVMALEDDECLATFNSWLEGYTVHTPSGGMHVAVHLIGEGEQHGNTPLARESDGKVLAETRGNGGYVAAAPSNGRTHPSGNAWVQHAGSFEQIAWATEQEWQAVCAVISQFDAVAASETPPEPLSRPAVPGGVSLSTLEHGGNSWIEATGKPAMSMVLEAHGWTYDHSDAQFSYWARPVPPARESEGHSATVNHRDRLYCWSTSAHPVPHSPSHGDQTFDSIDVMGCYELGHLPSDAERTEIFRRLAGRTQPVNIPVDIPIPDPAWMPNDFWEATEWLSEIRRIAWGNQACPEALLGCAMSSYLVSVPSSIRLAATVSGATSPLNLYTTLVGGTGTGKSSILAVSRQLLGVRDDPLNYRYGIGLRSGEGLPEAVLLPVQRKRGEVETGPRPHRRGVQVVVDELATLSAQNSRLGDTSLSYFITAWTGGEGAKVGGFKASGDESFPADAVRVCAVFGVQPGVATELFGGRSESQGFPGRLVYFGMDHLGERLVAGHQVAITNLNLPYYSLEQGREIGTIAWPLSVQQEIIDWDYDGKVNGRPLIEGHRMLNRSRVGAGIGLMDQAAHPDLIHWQLAGVVERHSFAQRDRLVAAGQDVAVAKARHAGRMAHVAASAQQSAWIEERAVALAKAVHHSPHTARQVKDRFKHDVRHLAPEVVGYALERGWVQYSVDDRRKLLIAGESRPA